jgi:HD-GYP domain-containing protein (c-di-GMP phosphodiesterase class II)
MPAASVPSRYCGRILTGAYSEALKQRVRTLIACYRAFAKIGSAAMPYIAAWRESSREIWYEYAGIGFMALMDCGPQDLARTFREKVIDRRIYQYPGLASGVHKEVIPRDALNDARVALRQAGQRTGAVEAVYKVAAGGGRVVWLKDQATIEIHEDDGISLSLGLLTIVSKEMEAEDALKKHHDRLEAIVAERTAALTRLNMQLKQEIVEREQAQARLQESNLRLQRNLDEIVNAMSRTVEERDPYTAGHQRRTTDLAVALAREMGLPPNEIRGLQMAGLIHDIGKISIPSGILSKPGKLNDAEMQLIRRHPRVAYDILKPIDFPWPVDRIVLQHHEKYDGSGYPQGLRGEAILREARILCVADVVETIESHRPYRPGLGRDEALDEITRQRGVLFDPRVVDACLALFRSGRFHYHASP